MERRIVPVGAVVLTTFFALLYALRGSIAAIDRGEDPRWAQQVVWSLAMWWTCLPFLPPLAALVRRFPVGRPRPWRNAGVLLLGTGALLDAGGQTALLREFADAGGRQWSVWEVNPNGTEALVAPVEQLWRIHHAANEVRARYLAGASAEALDHVLVSQTRRGRVEARARWNPQASSACRISPSVTREQRMRGGSVLSAAAASAAAAGTAAFPPRSPGAVPSPAMGNVEGTPAASRHPPPISLSTE